MNQRCELKSQARIVFRIQHHNPIPSFPGINVSLALLSSVAPSSVASMAAFTKNKGAGGKMLIRNIAITPNEPVIEVWVDDKNLDLHNNADFMGYRYSIADRELEMIWNCRLGTDQEAYLTLTFRNVHFLRIEGRDPEMPFEEDKTLTHLFLYLNDTNVDAVEFTFWGGVRILIKAAELSAHLEKSEG